MPVAAFFARARGRTGRCARARIGPAFGIAFGALGLVLPATGANPDLSAIGDTRAAWSDESDEVHLTFEELEIAIVGPVNPYASAEVYVGAHDGSFEVEEAKLILDRALPGGFALTIGRMLLDFGQLNPVHTHAYPFVDRPRMHTEFFVEEGILDEGARLDWLAPLDALTLRASAGAVRGDLFLGGDAHGHGGGGEEEVAPAPEVGWSGRVDLFFEPVRDVSVGLGGSVLRGTHDPEENARATWFDADLKVHADLGPDRAFVVNAEAVFGSLDATAEAPSSDPNGFFASADFRASARWNAGGFAESWTERAADDERTLGAGVFLGFALHEESTLFRIVGRRTDPDGADAVHEILVQTIFGLGPHRPHRF